MPEYSRGELQRYTALAADAAANSTTTGVKVMTLPALSPGTWAITFWVTHVSAATTTGVKFGVNHTGTVTSIVCQAYYTGSGTDTTQSGAAAAKGMAGSSARATSTTAPNLGPNTDMDATTAQLTVIDVLLRNSTGGDLELWHASEVAASSTVSAGTAVVAFKVA